MARRLPADYLVVALSLAFVLAGLGGNSVRRADSWGAMILAATAGECDDDKGKDAVEKLMKRVHKGRQSPYRLLRSAVEATPPDWKIAQEQLPAFVEMGQLLKTCRNNDIRESADGYADSVVELGKQVKVKNVVKVRDAFRGLSESCGDCHYRGGVGGKLD